MPSKNCLGDGSYRSVAWAARQMLIPIFPKVLAKYATVGIYLLDPQPSLARSIVIDRTLIMGKIGSRYDYHNR